MMSQQVSNQRLRQVATFCNKALPVTGFATTAGLLLGFVAGKSTSAEWLLPFLLRAGLAMFVLTVLLSILKATLARRLEMTEEQIDRL